jgi:hypothetical protein
VIIAPSADVFFWEGGEIGCSYSLDRAVFWLFGDTNSDIAASGTVRVNCIDEADPLLCSRGNSPSELQALQTFGTFPSQDDGLSTLHHGPLTKRTADEQLQVLGRPLNALSPRPSSSGIFRHPNVTSGTGCHPVDLMCRHIHRSGGCPASVVAGRNGHSVACTFYCGNLQRPPRLRVSTSLNRGLLLGSHILADEPLGLCCTQRFCCWYGERQCSSACLCELGVEIYYCGSDRFELELARAADEEIGSSFTLV